MTQRGDTIMRTPCQARAPLEVWGGIECTVNRVGDTYLDQIELNGHATRRADLDRFAHLGIYTLRYPVLWERHWPDPVAEPDWSWADDRLQYLRALRIRPIVGLVHHGSGPLHTSLLDSGFATGLAEYAGRVARRYPWVQCYTPVNEPLTTARFSGLYGHWYPHRRDALSFIQALLQQCRAVVLAMRAIRAVNPAAQLVQTDDLGKIFSTPMLAYQAEFENERRWLSWDLLCGRVNRQHALYDYLRWVGIEDAELAWFVENPCPPDVLGVNYYITSERFLDERLDRYPGCTHGGNGRHHYADVEAVRVHAHGLAGPGALLREAWERYHLPLALTEVHLGCHREEQLRWLAEVWEAAQAQRATGVDVRAVTVWSLLGAFDWDSLVTRANGHYEPGVFDVRSAQPRPTALATMVHDLAVQRPPQHPVLASPGWWHRPERLLYPGISTAGNGYARGHGIRGDEHANRPIVITGATGTLGRAFALLCRRRALPYVLLNRQQLDIAEETSVETALNTYRPWAVINTAGYVQVDRAEAEPARCFRENTTGPATLAAACARHGAALLTFSSDLVFDGRLRRPYEEGDDTAPLNVYGRSKAEAEHLVLRNLPSAFVVRTSAFFGPWDEYNFLAAVIRTLAAGETFRAADDIWISPTYVPDLVHTCLDLLIDGEQGIWHLSNRGAVTWADLARQTAELAGFDAYRVAGVRLAAQALAAPRPVYSVLGSSRAILLPPLEDALRRYFEQVGSASNELLTSSRQGRSKAERTSCVAENRELIAGS